MKSSFLLALVCVACSAFGQEALFPIGAEWRSEKKTHLKSTVALDSSFVYTYDTLTLPLLDEFSHSKFQSHVASPGDPNVTEQQYFKFYDLSNVPMPASMVYTSTSTKRFTTSSGTTTETFLPSTVLNYNSLTTYPFIYSQVNAFPPYYIYDTLDFVNDPDTVYVPTPDYLQDSARIFTAHLQDQNAYWINNSAYLNYTHALNPWTLGVVTFDGLDETGYPYNIGTTQSGYADVLQSKVVDLSANSPLDSIYFSCLIQPEGLGDSPEAEDSLVIEFYNKTTALWDVVYSLNGGAVHDWHVVHLPITHIDYLTDAFQFRFRNYGGLSGMLDEFHIDYVHLRAASGWQDTLFKDFAFVYPTGSLIENYSEVPWEHWVNDPTHMNSAVSVTVRNGSNVAENNLDGAVKVYHSGALEGTFLLDGQQLSNNDVNYAPRTVYSSLHDFSAGYSFTTTPVTDQKVFDIVSIAGAQYPNLNANDSAYTQQRFGNEYAYDDGTAEAAYGVIGAQARVACRFVPYEADTLLGVKMHWVPTVHDWSNKLFILTVWADDNGKPGTVLYEDDFINPHTPIYGDDRGVFVDYYLTDTRLALLNEPFFVGWRQVDSDRLNIGFDRNTDRSSNTFFSLNGGVTWTGSSLPGSMMIRPIFSTSNNYNVGLSENSASKVEWTVAPNPVVDQLSIRWNDENPSEGAVIIGLDGKVHQTIGSFETVVDLSNVPAGVYFLKSNASGTVIKLMKQ